MKTEKAIIGLAKILISTEQFNVSILSIKSVEEIPEGKELNLFIYCP